MICEFSANQNLLFYLQMGFASLSVISSIGMVWVYFYVKSLQVFYFRIVIYVAITDCLRSVLYMIPLGVAQLRSVCVAVAILDTAFAFNLILWTSLISLILYQVILNSMENFVKYERTFKVLSFVCPLFYLLPLITDSYGLNETVCTYTNTLAGNIWRLCLYSIPAWLFSLASLFAFYKIFTKLKQIKLNPETKQLIETVFIYPILLLVVLFFVTIVRLIEIFSNDSCVFFLFYVISILLTSLQGFLNAIIFFFTPEVKQALKSKIREKRIHSVFINHKPSPRRRETEINLLESTDSFVNQIY